MPAKIRLARRGRKKKATYDIVVADSRSPRDGRFIEKIGLYNPNTDPASITLNEEKALDWVMKGAQPTDTARAILSYRGVMMKKHLQVGVNKGAITQEDADQKFNDWLAGKEDQIQGKVDKLSKAKADKSKAALDAESKVNQARIDAQLTRQKELEAALAAEVSAASASEEETALTEEGEEAIAEIVAEETAPTAAEETPVAEPEAVAAKEDAPKEEETPAKEEAPAEPEASSEEDKKLN